MRASQLLGRARVAAFGAVLALAACNNQRTAPGPAGSGAVALADIPEPAGALADLRVARPDATYRALRELGSPLSSLLPSGFPLLAASLLGLPPLSADSFDHELPVVGLLVQGEGSEPAWVLALHVLSGPELRAKLTTGARAPFAVAPAGASAPGLELLSATADAGASAGLAFGLFDNYLVASANRDALIAAGPYTARMLPRRPAARGSIAVRCSQQALDSRVVPSLRALWAGYRTQLAHRDQSDRSAHGGRAPDFADPSQVILGADALAESLLSLVDGARGLELDLEPFPDRLEATLSLDPEPGSEVQARLAALAPGNARALLSLPAETQLALGLVRTPSEREAAGKSAGEDWVRLLGSRLRERDAQQLRAALADWELGRGTQARYGFLGGTEPGAFLITDVADGARLKRSASGIFALLAVPGIRAPVGEFLGQPQVSEAKAEPQALPLVSRKRVEFSVSAQRPAALPPLTFAWLVEEQLAFAAASKHADSTLKSVVLSARGERPTLESQVHLAGSVQRAGEQSALFAYLDARVLLGGSSPVPLPVVLSVGKRDSGAALWLEVSKPALDQAVNGMVGR